MNTVTMDDLRPRVEQGAAWLDAHRPGWFAKVNLDTLNLRSESKCVVCHVTGKNFGDGLYALGVFNEPEKFGFAYEQIRPSDPLHGGDWPEFWRVLQDCWTTAILERRTDPLTVAINALPEHLRDYVHDLESRADPAGDLRARRVAEDAAEAYRREIDRLMAIAFVKDEQPA